MSSDYILKDVEAVILANGEFPSARLPLHLLHTAPMVVCCDGGADAYIARGMVPHVIIGDGDSLSEENRERFSHLIHYVSDQETNDQTKAVTYLMQKGISRIAIVGATGKREDHTLGNISLLVEYMRMGAEVRMYTDYGVFIPCSGDRTFFCNPGSQVSIFNFGARHFRSEGLRYPIYDFSTWWQGTLNECVENKFTLCAEGEYLVFVTY